MGDLGPKGNNGMDGIKGERGEPGELSLQFIQISKAVSNKLILIKLIHFFK